MRHWAHGGETKPSNLVCLCRVHHRQVHEGRVLVEVLNDGAFRFVRPDGRAFESTAPERTQPFTWSHLPQMHRDRGIPNDEHTALTRWRGERLDYSIATEILLSQSRRTPNVPAGTRTAAMNN